MTSQTKKNLPICNECGNTLILVSKKVETIEGGRSPVTTTIYRCSDENCQKEMDKRNNQRLQKKKELDLAKIARMEKMRMNRRKSSTA